VTYAELHLWKGKPGYNDDWKMTADWATSVGKPTTYEQAKEAFYQDLLGNAAEIGECTE